MDFDVDQDLSKLGQEGRKRRTRPVRSTPPTAFARATSAAQVSITLAYISRYTRWLRRARPCA